MGESPLRKILAAAVLMSVPLLAFPAFGQDAQQKQELKTDQAVKESQQPEPTAQGVRPPKSLSSDQQRLNDALDAVLKNPVDLQGHPIPSQTDTTGEPGTLAGK